jgi:hypothetical protein
MEILKLHVFTSAMTYLTKYVMFQEPSTKAKDKKKRKTKKSDKDHPQPYHTIDINAARASNLSGEHPLYCNVDGRLTPRAFEEPAAAAGNVIVNPMMSPFHTRLRTLSPATASRPPLSPYSARLAATNTLSSSQSTPTKNAGGGGSIYYYSDTLRTKHSAAAKKNLSSRPGRDLQNGGRVDSDSGISVSRADFPMDEAPSLRQQGSILQNSITAVNIGQIFF